MPRAFCMNRSSWFLQAAPLRLSACSVWQVLWFPWQSLENVQDPSVQTDPELKSEYRCLSIFFYSFSISFISLLVLSLSRLYWIQQRSYRHSPADRCFCFLVWRKMKNRRSASIKRLFLWITDVDHPRKTAVWFEFCHQSVCQKFPWSDVTRVFSHWSESGVRKQKRKKMWNYLHWC